MSKSYAKFILSLCLILPITCKIQTTHQKIIFFGLKDVLLKADINAVPGGLIGSFIGISPEAVEQELFKTLYGIRLKKIPNRPSTGIYSPLLCYWLTTPDSSMRTKQLAHQYIKKYWFLKKLRLSRAIEIAFTPEHTATVFKPNQEILELIQLCKCKGHTIALCANWNKESFDALVQKNNLIFSLFDKIYISAKYHMMTFDKPFFSMIIQELQTTPENCYLIDRQNESMYAAEQIGIKIVRYTTISQVQKTLKQWFLL